MALKLTDKAIVQIKEIIATQNMSLETTAVRVGIRGKSCSGSVYAFGLDEEEIDPEYNELQVQDGLKIVYNKEFEDDLKNVTVDLKEAEDKRGFTFTNPLQVLSGGCGSGGCGSGGGCSA